MATSLGQIILFRVIQGLAGGGLQPSSQGVLLDAFPPEKQGTAQTMFGVAALLAPVVGPTLGGYLTVQYDWRWIFYINLPVGVLAFVMCYFVVDDPDYLKQQRAQLLRKPLNFDYIGLGLLALVMSSWEIMLSKGQEWDWLGDPFWRIQTLLILLVLGLGCLLFREMRIGNPIVNFRAFGERNFSACCVIIFCAYAVLYGASTSLPGLLQSLFGYDAYVSGLVQSPSGVGAVVVMMVVGALIGRGVDARWMIGGGLLVMAAGCYWMALMNLYISPWQVIWPRNVMIAGLSMIFAPLNVAAFKYTPAHLRGAAVGLMALLRNEGGSVGTSMAQTMQERREQFHLSPLDDVLTPLNPHVHAFLQKGQAFFIQRTGDPPRSREMTVQVLANLRQQQAASLAYFDVFWLCAALGVGLVILVLLMKRLGGREGRTRRRGIAVIVRDLSPTAAWPPCPPCTLASD